MVYTYLLISFFFFICKAREIERKERDDDEEKYAGKVKSLRTNKIE